MRQALMRFRYILGIPSALVVAALLLGNTATDVILDAIPSLWGELVWLGGLAILTGVLFTRWEARFRKDLNSSNLGQLGTEKLPHRRGAVILLGLDAADTDGAIAKLLKQASSLEWIALVGTPQTAERGVAKDVKEKLLPLCGRSIPASHLRTWEFGNAESVSDSEQAVQEAIEWMLEEGVTPAELVVDVTNGRRPMHFGALEAASAHDVEVQYLAAVWDHMSNQAVKGQEAFKVVRERHTVEDLGR